MNVIERIKEVSRESMAGALQYGQADIDNDGHEKYVWLDDYKQLSFLSPFFRTQVGYEHTYFILDVEVEIVEQESDNTINRLKIALEEFKEWTANHPDINFFWKFSGGRGIHGMQIIPHRINPGELKKVVSHLFPEWNKDGKFLTKRIRTTINNREVNALIEIDLSLYKTKQLIRWVYSPYRKNGQLFFSVPIIDWNAEKTLWSALFRNLEIKEYDIPEFNLYDLINLDRDLPADDSRLDVYRSTPKFTIEGVKDDYLELSRKEKEIIKSMEKDVLDDERYCPKIKQLFFDIKTKRGMFYGRVVLLRFFATLHYSPKDICHFFRFKVNDAADNESNNRWKLIQQVTYWYGHPDHPNPMPTCNILMDKNSSFFICDDPCGRSYPLEKHHGEGDVKFDRYASFESIKNHVETILDRKSHTVIYKPTRAGVTTSLIIEIARSGRRGLFLSPTNAIARQTFKEAMEIANNEGIKINGAVISANQIACKRLKDIKEDLSVKFGKHNKWNNMIYHSKPACFKRDGSNCQFFNSTFSIPLYDEDNKIVPVIGSSDKCAFATIVNRLEEFQIVFITYQKLMVVLENEAREYRVVKDMINEFDVIIMDEISQYTNHSPLQLIISSLTRVLDEDRIEDRNIFDHLKKQYHRLSLFRSSRRIRYIPNRKERVDDILSAINHFVTTYSNFVIDDPLYRVEKDNNMMIVTNTLDDDKKELLATNAGAYHRIIEEFTKETNEYPRATDEVLSLLRTDSWIASSITTPFKPYNLSFIASPSATLFIEFIQEFGLHGQLIATDATMPDVKMSDFFGVIFTDYNVNDPRGTNNLQLIITDNRNISSVDLTMKNERGINYRNDLVNFISSISRIHDKDNIIIVSPNKTIDRIINNWMINDSIEEMDHTYFRSSQTIGVRCEKRVMITISSPLSPLASHLWLGYYFKDLMGLYPDITVPEVGNKLRLLSARSNFYQTIGRAKDPKAVERSVVYTWGINGNSMPAGKFDMIKWITFVEDMPQPYIFTPASRIGRETISLIGDLWKRKGIILTTVQHLLLNKLMTSTKDRLTLGDIRNSYKEISGDELKVQLDNIPSHVFKRIGFSVKKTGTGRVKFIRV